MSCKVPNSSYAKMKNTGCYKPYNPLEKVTVQPPVACLHTCSGCNMNNAPCASKCCK